MMTTLPMIILTVVPLDPPAVRPAGRWGSAARACALRLRFTHATLPRPLCGSAGSLGASLLGRLRGSLGAFSAETLVLRSARTLCGSLLRPRRAGALRFAPQTALRGRTARTH